MERPQITAEVLSGGEVKVTASSLPLDATKTLFYAYKLENPYATPVEVAGITHTFTGLSAGVWVFTARYANETEKSLYSEKAYVILSENAVNGTYTATDIIEPEAPINVSAVVLEGNTSIKMTWDAATDNIGVVGYRVYKNSVLVTTLAASAREYTYTALATQRQYVLEVSAIDAAGNESPKQKIQIYTSPDTTAPTKPTWNTITTYAGRNELSFFPGTDANSVVRNDIIRNGVKIGSSTTSTYSDTAIIPGQVYTYQIASVDGAGNISEYSDSRQVVALTQGDSQAPTAGVLTGNVVGTSQINVSFTAPSDNIGVVKQEIVRNGVVIKEYYDSLPHDYSDINLQEGTQYDYFIRVYDASGNSATGNTFSGTTPIVFSPYKFYQVQIVSAKMVPESGVIN